MCDSDTCFLAIDSDTCFLAISSVMCTKYTQNICIDIENNVSLQEI